MVAGVGVIPSTEFLKDSGVSLTKQGFVNVDKHLRVKSTEDQIIPNVFAAGDIVMYPQK